MTDDVRMHVWIENEKANSPNTLRWLWKCCSLQRVYGSEKFGIQIHCLLFVCTYWIDKTKVAWISFTKILPFNPPRKTSESPFTTCEPLARWHEVSKHTNNGLVTLHSEHNEHHIHACTHTICRADTVYLYLYLPLYLYICVLAGCSVYALMILCVILSYWVCGLSSHRERERERATEKATKLG